MLISHPAGTGFFGDADSAMARLSVSGTKPGGRLGKSRGLLALMLALSLAGLAASVKLALIHAQVHSDPNVESFCALSEGVNCDTVALSEYSVFAGLPVAVWGILGYATIGTTVMWRAAARSRRLPNLVLLMLTGFAASVSVTLGTISFILIDSVCILCLATYVINASLLGVSVVLWRQQLKRRSLIEALAWALPRWRRVAPLLGTAGALALILMLVYPRYWEAPGEMVATAEAAPAASSSSCADESAVVTGVTDDGHPFIGARHPLVTVVEYSDYQCPHCSRAHRQIRTLTRAHAGKVRLVHRHFPLDETCNPIVKRRFHPHACYYSLLAICAAEQDKFWAANDYLYDHGRDSEPAGPEALARELSLDLAELNDCIEHRARSTLDADIAAGLKLRIRGTPTFDVEGELHTGALPAEVLVPFLGERDPMGAG